MRTPLILSLLLLLAACGGAPDTAADVISKRAERDSLKVAREDINKRIAEAEAWLAKNDPELTRNLTPVTTFALAMKPFAHYTEAHGSVKADENALLFSTTGGEVRRILVKAGQSVRRGQLIVDLDTDALRNNVAQARANVALANEVFTRQDQLWKQKIGSEVQFLEAKTRKDAGEAQLAALQDQLNSAQIKAPFDGVVDEVFPSIGDMANPMEPVARVVSLGKASIECDLSEGMLGKVSMGDPVEVHVTGSEKAIAATIDQIGQYINPNNRTFKVTLRMENGTKFRPNQLVNVRIRDMEAEEALVVPSRLVMENASGRSYVYMTQNIDGIVRAQKVFVTVMAAQGGDVMIAKEENGLKGTETLIDQGSRLVVDRQEVNVIKGA